jgi:hypothetical protein
MTETFKIDAKHIDAFKNALDMTISCYATKYDLKDDIYHVTLEIEQPFVLFYLGSLFQIEKKLHELQKDKKNIF